MPLMSNTVQRRDFLRLAGTAALGAATLPRWGVPRVRPRAIKEETPSADRAALGFPKGFFWGAATAASAGGDRFPLFMAMREIGNVIALDQRAVLSRPFPVCRDSVPYRADAEARRRTSWAHSAR